MAMALKKIVALIFQRAFYLPRVLPGTNKKITSLRPRRLSGENPGLDKSGMTAFL
jgi:hypothetical protein